MGKELILFLLTYVVVFIIYQVLIVSKVKKKKASKDKDFKDPVEVLYLVNKYKLNMKKVYIAAEGQAEASVVKKILCPYFIQKGINLIPHTIETSTDRRNGRIHKGGITTYASARNTIANCISSLETLLDTKNIFSAGKPASSSIGA